MDMLMRQMKKRLVADYFIYSSFSYHQSIHIIIIVLIISSFLGKKEEKTFFLCEENERTSEQPSATGITAIMFVYLLFLFFFALIFLFTSLFVYLFIPFYSFLICFFIVLLFVVIFFVTFWSLAWCLMLWSRGVERVAHAVQACAGSLTITLLLMHACYTSFPYKQSYLHCLCCYTV